MTEEKKYRVLFVCSGNTCRSPMAEYALRALLEQERPGQAEVMSAGTLGITGRPATLFAQEAGKIWDLDLEPHRSQALTVDLIGQADLILAMAPEHLHQIERLGPKALDKSYLLKEFPDPITLGGAVEDPIGQDLEQYNETFLEIGELLGKHLPEIVKRLDEKLNAA